MFKRTAVLAVILAAAFLVVPLASDAESATPEDIVITLPGVICVASAGRLCIAARISLTPAAAGPALRRKSPGPLSGGRIRTAGARKLSARTAADI